MGKKANTIKSRACMLCKHEFAVTSKGLKEHFKACCKARRTPNV